MINILLEVLRCPSEACRFCWQCASKCIEGLWRAGGWCRQHEGGHTTTSKSLTLSYHLSYHVSYHLSYHVAEGAARLSGRAPATICGSFDEGDRKGDSEW